MAKTFDKNKIGKDISELLYDDTICVKLIFIVKNVDDDKQISYSFNKVTLEEDIQQDLLKTYKRKLNYLKTKLNSIPFDEYDPTYNQKGKKYKSIPSNNGVIRNILEEEIEEVEKFDKDFLDTIVGSIALITNGDKKVLIFKRLTKTNFLQQKNALWFKEGKLKEVKNNIFKLDYGIDFYWYDDFVILTNDILFNKLFKFNKIYRDNAKVMLNYFEKSSDFKINNFEDFRDNALNNMQMVKKLHDIQSKGIYNKVTFDNIKKVVKDFNLPIELDIQQRKIIYEDYNQIWTILNLFNDNHLMSSMTGFKYEVPAKKKIN